MRATLARSRLSEREPEKGWRLDYVLVSQARRCAVLDALMGARAWLGALAHACCRVPALPQALAAKAYDTFVMAEIAGSDHVPVGLILEMP